MSYAMVLYLVTLSTATDRVPITGVGGSTENAAPENEAPKMPGPENVGSEKFRT